MALILGSAMSTDLLLAEIDRQVAEHEHAAAEHERKAQELRIARKVVSGLLGSVQTHAPVESITEERARPQIGPVEWVHDQEGRLDFSDGSLTLPEASKLLLARVGKPMKAREIADALKEARFPTGTTDVAALRNNVSGSLNRRIRDYNDPDLEKFGTAFGLKAWKQRPIGNDGPGSLFTPERE